jgi:RimJ/RimL family protein N-acetyltransferase
MCYELEKTAFHKARPIVASCHLDPTIYAVIEGVKDGRIFADHPDNPQCVYIWTNTEWAYLVGEARSEAFYQSLHTLIIEELFPALDRDGRDFISNITYSSANRERLLILFARQRPLSPGVNIFTFNKTRFEAEKPGQAPLPVGFSLRQADRALMESLADQHMVEDFAFYWDSIEKYWTHGLGYCIMKDGQVVSLCNSDAYGNRAHRINIWTHGDYRGRDLARLVGAAFIKHCLAAGITPVYLCDEANVASRRLAERLGFDYVGNLYPVDVPLRPFPFYLGLGNHFCQTLQQYEQAAEFYETAFTIQEGSKENYYDTAVAYALAGNQEKAFQWLHQAIDLGWDDIEQLQNSEAFTPYKTTKAWQTIMSPRM